MPCQECQEGRRKMQGALQDFSDWVKQPFREDMNVLGWFAFLGLIIGILVAWGWLLRRFS